MSSDIPPESSGPSPSGAVSPARSKTLENDADAIAASHDFILKDQLKQMQIEEVEKQIKESNEADRHRP